MAFDAEAPPAVHFQHARIRPADAVERADLDKAARVELRTARCAAHQARNRAVSFAEDMLAQPQILAALGEGQERAHAVITYLRSNGRIE